MNGFGARSLILKPPSRWPRRRLARGSGHPQRPHQPSSGLAQAILGTGVRAQDRVRGGYAEAASDRAADLEVAVHHRLTAVSRRIGDRFVAKLAQMVGK